MGVRDNQLMNEESTVLKEVVCVGALMEEPWRLHTCRLCTASVCCCRHLCVCLSCSSVCLTACSASQIFSSFFPSFTTVQIQPNQSLWGDRKHLFDRFMAAWRVASFISFLIPPCSVDVVISWHTDGVQVGGHAALELNSVRFCGSRPLRLSCQGPYPTFALWLTRRPILTSSGRGQSSFYCWGFHHQQWGDELTATVLRCYPTTTLRPNKVLMTIVSLNTVAVLRLAVKLLQSNVSCYWFSVMECFYCSLCVCWGLSVSSPLSQMPEPRLTHYTCSGFLKQEAPFHLQNHHVGRSAFERLHQLSAMQHSRFMSQCTPSSHSPNVVTHRRTAIKAFCTYMLAFSRASHHRSMSSLAGLNGLLLFFSHILYFFCFVLQ